MEKMRRNDVWGAATAERLPKSQEEPEKEVPNHLQKLNVKSLKVTKEPVSILAFFVILFSSKPSFLRLLQNYQDVTTLENHRRGIISTIRENLRIRQVASLLRKNAIFGNSYS